jgi:hypothetical protein
MEMSYPFTIFHRPNGRKTEETMTKIRDEDAEFLRQNNVKISAEDCGPFFTIWADDGTMMEDDPTTPDEITYIVRGKETCEEAMANICNKIRERKGLT